MESHSKSAISAAGNCNWYNWICKYCHVKHVVTVLNRNNSGHGFFLWENLEDMHGTVQYYQVNSKIF